MKRTIGLLIAVVFALSIASVALARGAPTKQKAFTSKAAVIETVWPIVASVPVLAGYDVIQNLTTGQRDSIARNVSTVATTARRRLSPTVDWRSANRLTRQRNGFGRIEPVLLL